MNDIAVLAADRNRKTARTRLLGTAGELRTRVSPASLTQDAVEGLRDGTVSIAVKSAETVRKRPLVTALVAGAVGLFLARKKLGFGPDQDDPAPDATSDRQPDFMNDGLPARGKEMAK